MTGCFFDIFCMSVRLQLLKFTFITTQQSAKRREWIFIKFHVVEVGLISISLSLIFLLFLYVLIAILKDFLGWNMWHDSLVSADLHSPSRKMINFFGVFREFSSISTTVHRL